tara:strand:+ start:172 stop:381 length:210 start_codon:yes stop_codon:yes gene_type:complete
MKIEKGIPIQVFKRSLVSNTLKEMEFGDSVLIPKEDIFTRQRFHQVAARNNIKVFSRTVKEGVRIWRVK